MLVLHYFCRWSLEHYSNKNGFAFSDYFCNIFNSRRILPAEKTMSFSAYIWQDQILSLLLLIIKRLSIYYFNCLNSLLLLNIPL